MTAVLLCSLFAGVLAGVVVCKSWRLSVVADIVLSALSLVAMLAAAHLVEGIESPAALLAAGLGYAFSAMAGRVVKT